MRMRKGYGGPCNIYLSRTKGGRLMIAWRKMLNNIKKQRIYYYIMWPKGIEMVCCYCYYY